MSRNDIISGKEGFQKSDLMDYGSLYGMGSYFGEDYTAKYLVALGQSVSDQLASSNYHKKYQDLTPGDRYEIKKKMESSLRSVNLTLSTVILPDSIAHAISLITKDSMQALRNNNNSTGFTQAYSLSDTDAKNVSRFFLYSALTTIAHRPGSNYSWTNNWPYEPSVGNRASTNTFIWTWASLAILLFAIGATFIIFKFFIDRDEEDEVIINAPLQNFFILTPSQRAVSKFFLLVALLFLIQLGAGGIMAHYYSERANFYGINPISFLPFSFLRSIHLTAPILWIGLAWIGSSIFLAPFISGGYEPKGQKKFVNFLFYTSVLIIAGTVIGNYLGIMGVIKKNWFWFGSQGLSYLELGRFWQILLFVGFILWSILLLRALFPALRRILKQNRSFFGYFHLEYLIWYSSVGIVFMFMFGMIPLSHPLPSFTLTDFWRWWVVHLWVELTFELFASVILAYFLMATGLIRRNLAEKAVLFEWILIIVSGVLGTGHHYFWVGEPNIWIGIGSSFSFLEVLPLFLLILEAIQQYLKIKKLEIFHYRLAFLYILGSAFWNFIGAGVFGGGLVNSPLLNYYEHGTFLTLNHAHTALFGAFGLLALGLSYFTLRCSVGVHAKWSNSLGIWAFWLYNFGLVLWIALNFFPIGWAQLAAIYEHGYAYGRSLKFYNTTLIWQWLRLPGDLVFAAGAFIMAFDFIKKIQYSRKDYEK